MLWDHLNNCIFIFDMAFLQSLFRLSVLLLIAHQCHVVAQSNIVLIVTDDQDILSTGSMVKTMRLIAGKGATLVNSFVNTPLCCPSRSTLLTGLYQHNTQVWNNSIEGNCNSIKWQRKYEPLSFGPIFRRAGYRTFYAGKYLNQYGSQRSGGLEHIPQGWQWWAGLKGNSRYYNYSLSVNGSMEHYPTTYLTEHIHELALEFLRGQTTDGSPFLMMLAPPAPHAPYTPAPKYAKHFLNTSVPRSPNFNPTKLEDKHWMIRLPPSPLPDKVLSKVDEFWRQRWRTLMSVDDMVAGVVKAIEKINLLHKTFILVTSDNGYHLGHYGLPWDKRQPYDTDIRVPFFIRGPGVHKQVLKNAVMTADVAPTLLDMAGLKIPPYMDGTSFLSILLSKRKKVSKRAFLIEYVGEGGKSVSHSCPWSGDPDLSNCGIDSACKCQDARNNTYNCIRTISPLKNFLVCKFYDDENFIEVYNVANDPYQMKNIASRMNKQEMRRYDLIFRKLQSCSGMSCSF